GRREDPGRCSGRALRRHSRREMGGPRSARGVARNDALRAGARARATVVRVLRGSAIVFVVASCLPACTIAGGAIGSTLPDYTPSSVLGARDGSVHVGEKIAVVRNSD